MVLGQENCEAAHCVSGIGLANGRVLNSTKKGCLGWVSVCLARIVLSVVLGPVLRVLDDHYQRDFSDIGEDARFPYLDYGSIHY
jgi:hypothetical protein